MIDRLAEQDAERQFGTTPLFAVCSLCGRKHWMQDENRRLCGECNQAVIPAENIRCWGDTWEGEPAARVYATLLALQRRLDALLEKP